MKKVNYTEKNYLMQRTPTEQDADIGVDVFLVGDFKIAEWAENRSQCGNDFCEMYPAWVAGKRAFMIVKDWNPAPGYCASGTKEEIVNFGKGVSFLIKLGAYEWMFGGKE